MGFETLLYSVIAEAASIDRKRNAQFVTSNNKVLKALPGDNGFPPLNRSAFYANKHFNWNGSAGNYRGRTIVFSGRYKQLEDDFGEWLVKFESLLQRLFWEEAIVHLKTELFGCFVFEWGANPVTDILQPPDIKTFSGPFRKWEEFLTA